MLKTSEVLAAIFLVAAAAPNAAPQPRNVTTNGGHVRAEPRFSGIVTLAGGKKVNVVIQNWTIDERQQNITLDLPSNATVVVQVRAGSVFTTVNGQREQKGTEAWWTVPAGTPLKIETDQDSAILQTIAAVAQ